MSIKIKFSLCLRHSLPMVMTLNETTAQLNTIDCFQCFVAGMHTATCSSCLFKTINQLKNGEKAVYFNGFTRSLDVFVKISRHHHATIMPQWHDGPMVARLVQCLCAMRRTVMARHKNTNEIAPNRNHILQMRWKSWHPLGNILKLKSKWWSSINKTWKKKEKNIWCKTVSLEPLDHKLTLLP